MTRTRMTVIRDASGAVINIGPWDWRFENVPETDEQGQIIYDLRPEGGFVQRTVWTSTNPMPAGAYETEAWVEVNDMGGRAVVEDEA